MTREISRFEASIEAALAFIAKEATPEQRADQDELVSLVSWFIYNRAGLDDNYRRLTGRDDKISEKFSHRSSTVMPKAAYARIMHEVSMHVFENASKAEIIGMLTGRVARPSEWKQENARPCEWKQEDVIGYWVIRVGGYSGGDVQELSPERIALNELALDALLASRISS